MMTSFTTSNRADLAGRPATLESFREDNIVYSCTSHVDVTARTLLQTIAKRYQVLAFYFVQVNGNRHNNSANREQFRQLRFSASMCCDTIVTSFGRCHAIARRTKQPRKAI
jgi:hypothetical protein